MKRLRQIVVRSALRIERAKEPKLVLLNWTTNVAAGVDL